MRCEESKVALGAYVLDALDAHERAEVDVHLRTCAECRAELAELATLPPLLSRLSLQDLGESVPTVAAPDALFDKVVASVRDDAAGARVTWLRRRPARALLAAAAAVILLGGGVATTLELTGSSGTSATLQSATGTKGSVQMRVTLAPQATGTALRVAVSGLPEDEHCWLVAVADDGTRDSVGRWVATYAGDAQVTGSTSIPASHLRRLILLGGNDQELVSVPV
jgi:anti-sigma factor RsiW